MSKMIMVALCFVPALAHAREREVAQGESIQAAVDAAHDGDVLRISGLHVEQVTIGKALALIGDGAATIRAPLVMTPIGLPGRNGGLPVEQKVIVAVLNAEVTLENLVIDGARSQAPGTRFTGVVYFNSGGAVLGCEIKDVGYGALSPVAKGIGLRAQNLASGQRHLVISGNRLHGYNYQGIQVTGDGSDPGTTRLVAEIEDNVLVGAGPTDQLGQFGILVSRGATGTIRHNLISGHLSTAPLPEAATSIFSRFATGLRVEDNIIDDAEFGLVLIDQVGAVAAHNLVSTPGTGGAPNGTIGIWLEGDGSAAEHNQVQGPGKTVASSLGILMGNGRSVSATHNRISEVETGADVYSSQGAIVSKNHFVRVGLDVFLEPDAIGTIVSGNHRQ